MRRGLAFALFCLLIYVVTGSGVITHVDGVVYYAMSRRLVDHGALSLDRSDPALLANPEVFSASDGASYSHFNAGLAVLIAPFYAVGKVMSPILPRMAEFTAADFVVSATNAVVTAASVFLVVALGLELGYPLRAGLLAGAAFGFGSMAWNYATTLFSEPATGACVLLSVLLLVRSRRSARPAPLILAAGLAAGGAVFMRVSGLVFVPSLVVYLLLAHRRPGWRLVGLLAAFAIGCGVFVAATGWYNFARFGSVLETGYTFGSLEQSELAIGLASRASGRGADQILYALWALLFSPGRGIFLYAPVVLLGLLGLPAFARRRPLEATLVAILCVSLLLTESILPFDFWFGGWSYGPRYLVPIIGLASVCAAAWFERVSGGPSPGALAGGLLALLVVLQIPTVLVNVNTTYYAAQVARGTPLDHAYLVESWSGSTFVGAWRELAVVTQRSLRGEPVRRGRLSDLPDVATALDQAETLNSYQPWWLRLVQTGRLGGTGSAGVLVLVGMLLLAAMLALRVAVGTSTRMSARRTSGSTSKRVGLAGLKERGSA